MLGRILIFYLLVILEAYNVGCLDSNVDVWYKRLKGSKRALCPASNLIDLAIDGFHYYPIDIFLPSLSRTENLKYVYNCTSKRAKDTHFPNHRCASNVNPCPVYIENIRDATKRSYKLINSNYLPAFSDSSNDFVSQFQGVQLQRPYLYSFWEAMFDPNEVIRVIVFGGSGALGADSQGCYCQSKWDSKCHFNAKMMKNRKNLQEECRWANPFTRWLRSKSLATVLQIPMEVAASVPYNIAVDLTRRLKEVHVESLTSNDIILLDYSLNEVGKYSQSHQQYEMEAGMERLIRGLLHLAKRNDSMPTIVLVETCPFAQDGAKDLMKPPDRESKVDYSRSYTKLGSYYNLPIWSLRDVVWSNFSRTHPVQSQYISELRAPDHPVWYIHLFYADVMAAIMERELEKCFYYKPTESSHEYVIPPPLIKLSDHKVCDESIPSLLDMTAEGVFYSETSRPIPDGKKLSIVGSYEVHRGGTKYEKSPHANESIWKLMEDKPRKFGWINALSESPPTQSLSVVYFKFNEAEALGNTKYLLQFHYMRTYEHAGKVALSLCGSPIAELDALWDDYRTYRYSLVETYLYPVDAGTIKSLCPSTLSPNDKAAADRSSFISVTHQYVTDHIEARKSQKFKIIQVRMCKQGAAD